VEDILNFDYRQEMFNEADSQVPRSNASYRSGMTDAIDYQAPKGIFEDEYVVLDQKKVPQNMIESIEKRTIKINRRLKKSFLT